MEKTLDMQSIRYINLFGKITRVNIQHCFHYNANIIFVVPRQKIAKAVGEEGTNIKKLSEILNRKIKVVPLPDGREDIEKFITAIVHPIKFKSLEIKDDTVTINAGKQSKAALIGRNRSRLNEMEKILDSYFGIKEIKVS